MDGDEHQDIDRIDELEEENAGLQESLAAQHRRILELEGFEREAEELRKELDESSLDAEQSQRAAALALARETLRESTGFAQSKTGDVSDIIAVALFILTGEPSWPLPPAHVMSELISTDEPDGTGGANPPPIFDENPDEAAIPLYLDDPEKWGHYLYAAWRASHEPRTSQPVEWEQVSEPGKERWIDIARTFLSDYEYHRSRRA